MSLKDIIDFSIFTDNKESQDLYSNSIRRAFRFDAYGDQDVFEAVVLTNPIPLESKQIDLFYAAQQDNPEELEGTPPPQFKKIGKYVYRARILGANSPHNFLPDPCNPIYAQNTIEAQKIIAMHTLFYSNEEEGVGLSLPKVGSIVQVRLTKNKFSYDIQTGEHVKLVKNSKSEITLNNSCSTIEQIIRNSSGTSLDSFFGGEFTPGQVTDAQVEALYQYWRQQYPDAINLLPDGECGGAAGYSFEKCVTEQIGGNEARLHPKFLTLLKEVMTHVEDVRKQRGWNEGPLTVGSTSRSTKAQMFLRIQNATRPMSMEELLSLPSSNFYPMTAPIQRTSLVQASRHITGLAVDFGGPLYKGKDDDSLARARATETFKYMKESSDFKRLFPGFQHKLRKETWHWSPTGD